MRHFRVTVIASVVLAFAISGPLFAAKTKKAPAQQKHIHSPSLVIAARDNDSDRVKNLMAKGICVNSWDSDKRTALMEAAKNGNRDLVRYLLDQGADYAYVDKDDQTAALDALCGGYRDIVKMINQHKDAIDAQKYNIQTVRMKGRAGKVGALNTDEIPGARGTVNLSYYSGGGGGSGSSYSAPARASSSGSSASSSFSSGGGSDCGPTVRRG